MTRRAARGQDYPAFTEIWARIGENPARFLTETNDFDPKYRIRGINSETVLDDWYTVEEELGPRPRIMRRLNLQRRYLRESTTGETFLEWRDRVQTEAESSSRRAVADGGEQQ